MANTGGALNELNGQMGISAAENSVPIMKLIKIHKPKSRSALVDLIEFHFREKCPCGIVSQGTIYDFGQNLYAAQIKLWGTYRYTLKECVQWEYDLFITNSLRGELMEKKAISKLRENSSLKFFEAKGYLDEEIRVDILVKSKQEIIGGIQVKPESYKKMRTSVKERNTNANKMWAHPVLYLFYGDDEKFINLKSVLKELSDLES